MSDQQHAYVNNSYLPEEVQSMKDGDLGSGVVRSFINSDELAFCRQEIENIKEWPEHGKTSKYLGASWVDPLGQPLKEIFEDKLGNLLGDYTLDFFAYQEAIQPWKVHADIRWYDRPKHLPQHVVLIPLDVITNGEENNNEWDDTYSIMFKQRNYLSNQKNTNKAELGNTDQKSWSRPCENPSAELFTEGYNIDKDVHKKYLSHMPYDWMEGLEIETIYKWEKMSCGHWDQNQLHCADNFLAKNIKTKLSLIFFTNQG